MRTPRPHPRKENFSKWKAFSFLKALGPGGPVRCYCSGVPWSLRSLGPWGISLWLPAVVLYPFITWQRCVSCVQFAECQHQASLAMKCEKLRYLWGWYCPRETLDQESCGKHAQWAPSSSSTQLSCFHRDLELTGKNTNDDIMLTRFNTFAVRSQLAYSFWVLLIHYNIIKNLEVC